jgi:ABC-type transporter Mla subunit MlaD
MERGLVRVTVELEPGVTVPGGTTALITRRRPIGDLTLELVSGTGAPLPDGATIGAADTSPPPEAERTIEVLADLLHAVPSRDLQTVLAELSTALRGRGRDLAALSESTSALPERILEVQRELESLITTGPEVTGVFAANADTSPTISRRPRCSPTSSATGGTTSSPWRGTGPGSSRCSAS